MEVLTSNNLALPLFSLIFLGEKKNCPADQLKAEKRGYQCSFLAFCNYVFSSSLSNLVL